MTGPLIGNSFAFREVTEAIAMVAPVDSGVLLLGETGTGKEVIARAIHDAGPRRHQRFVAVNCAAIPVSLLESELFGHERGALSDMRFPSNSLTLSGLNMAKLSKSNLRAKHIVSRQSPPKTETIIFFS